MPNDAAYLITSRDTRKRKIETTAPDGSAPDNWQPIGDVAARIVERVLQCTSIAATDAG